jgi:hypothetical protein
VPAQKTGEGTSARPEQSSDPAIDLATFARDHGPSSKRYSSDAATIAPPPSSEVEIEITGEMPLDMGGPAREPMPTLTDEVELEQARLKSVMSSIPPRGAVPTPAPILSLANERTPSSAPASEPSTRRVPVPPQAQLPSTQLPTEEDFSDLVSDLPTAPPPPEVVDVIAKERGPEPRIEMRERLALGDYTGALQIAEKIIAEHPGNSEAVTVAEECKTVLIKMYQARLGPLDRVPFIIVARNELRWLSIDHRAGFVLSHVDGISSLEMILDVSGMAPLDCLRILHELVQQRIIGFR